MTTANIVEITAAGVNHIVVSGITVSFNETKEEVIALAKAGDGDKRIHATVIYTNGTFGKREEKHYFDITSGKAGTVVALRNAKKTTGINNDGGKLFTDIII